MAAMIGRLPGVTQVQDTGTVNNGNAYRSPLIPGFGRLRRPGETGFNPQPMVVTAAGCAWSRWGSDEIVAERGDTGWFGCRRSKGVADCAGFLR